jgi:sulfite reductase beta subunit-like hemoprotein
VALTRIARHLAKVTEERGDFQLVPLSEDGIDVVVILCGCPRACGNKAEVRARANQSLLTAGESLNGRHVPEAHLPSAVEQELIKILDS